MNSGVMEFIASLTAGAEVMKNSAGIMAGHKAEEIAEQVRKKNIDSIADKQVLPVINEKGRSFGQTNHGLQMGPEKGR